MEKLKKHVADNKLLYRMIAIYTIVCMSVILLVTTAMYSGFSREIKDEIYRFQIQSLRQVSNTVSFRAEYANNLMLQVKMNSQTSRLFYSGEQDVVVESLKSIDELRSAVKQLHSVYIFNEYDNRIYYSGENIIPAISTVDDFQDKGFVEMLNSIENYPKFTPFLRMFSVDSPNGRSYQTYVYTYFLYDSYSSGSIRNIVAFNFYTGWMKDAMDFISPGQNTSEDVWIVNHDRQILYSSTGNLIGTQVDAELLPDEVLEGEAGYLITGRGKDRKMLVYASPSYTGYDDWIFLSWNDYSALMEPLERVRNLIYIICIAAITFSLLLIVGLSMVLYKPVRLIMDRTEILERDQKEKQRLERAQFLRKLFLGNVQNNLQVIQDSFTRYQIEGETEGDIRLLLVSVDYINSYCRQIGSEVEAADNRIEQVLEKCCRAYYEDFLCVKMQSGIWGFCVPVREENEEFDELFNEMNQALETMDITVSMAVSPMGHSARDIPYLYSEVVNIHSYLYLRGQNKLINDEDIHNQGQNKFEYPHEMEKKFLGQLFGGKYEESIDAYEEFVAAVTLYTVEEIKLSFMLLAYAVKNTSQKTMAETSSILVEFDNFYKKLQAVETIDEVNHMFHNLISEITEKQQLFSRERYERLIEQIKAYVGENYGDISLSVNQVSDHVNMSAAYLGRVFKQVAGITFTEYLTKYRLDIACNLLKDTDMTVNEISDAVGFTNSSYFHIIFKKNLNCTPNQYRKQC